MKQEDKEKFYLTAFLKCLNYQYSKLERDSNPPDFVLIKNGLRIAIEITDFHSSYKSSRGFPRRLVEEEWRKLQGVIAKERGKEIDLNEISCWLRFKELLLPSSKESLIFARELVRFIKSHLSDFSVEVKKFDDFSSFPVLKKYLGYLSISKVGCYITWDWNFLGGFVGLFEQELIDTIQDKMNLTFSADLYKEIWLLVVSGGEGLSQSMGLPSIEELREFSKVNRILKKGCFQKMYIFQYMFNRIVEWEKARGWILVKDR